MRQLKIIKQTTNKNEPSLNFYLKDINPIALITGEEEVELTRKIKAGDQRALNTLITSNLRFVVSVAKQYQFQGLSLSDLIAEGNMGLIKAANRFDETRGFKFISYAVWWIRQGIVQSISENARVVRLPLNKIAVINKIRKANSELQQLLQRDASSEEISEFLQLPLAEIEQATKSNATYLSLDKPLTTDSDNLTLGHIIKSETDDPDQKLLTKSVSKEINQLMNVLKHREKEIIILLYGLNGREAKSLKDVSKYLGLTSERVRQIKEMGIFKLRNSPKTSNVFLDFF
ncbi:sigma-70 family RNA polymerase sigma factor [Zunongwangia sp. HGR-M22]|uniref:sigma-70 family RNA polymerase sigma factor n=1 Tax=Zunongwangia sp. HGR-M22 TaxID=3015168 RepID=UPI0022DD56B5|nr:RNA polymerase sigma factor RpoD/SigA [Zunongwangia sp. HGR-M22]WBL27261.1 RNA polymerase sigma factor RpoD/SigA [Zunongwangia sp. HGR-M22]